MPEHLPHGQARQDHVAEAPPAPFAVGDIHRGRKMRAVAGKEPRKNFRLVFASAAGEAAEVRGNLLKTADIRIGERLRLARDAPRIDAAIDAAAPLDVPVEKFQGKTGC